MRICLEVYHLFQLQVFFLPTNFFPPKIRQVTNDFLQKKFCIRKEREEEEEMKTGYCKAKASRHSERQEA